MGKAMALLGVGAGGTAAAAGGNYALGDPIGKALWKKPAETVKEEAEEEVVDAQDTEEEEGEQDQKHCIEDYFPGLDLSHEQEDTNK